MTTAKKMAPARHQILAEISNAARNGYPFYVYALSDSKGVFYIGKGTKARLFDHMSRREMDANVAKRARLMASKNIEHATLAYFNNEDAAYRHEAILIRETKGLTNIAMGEWMEPIERARRLGSDMLERLVPFEQWAPTKAAAAFQKITGVVSLHDLYEKVKAEILKQISSPAPTTIAFDKHGKTVGLRYNERHGTPFKFRRIAQ